MRVCDYTPVIGKVVCFFVLTCIPRVPNEEGGDESEKLLTSPSCERERREHEVKKTMQNTIKKKQKQKKPRRTQTDDQQHKETQ